MKNCGGCSDALRKLILNIPNHYMVLAVVRPTSYNMEAVHVYIFTYRESTLTAIQVRHVMILDTFPVGWSSLTLKHVRHCSKVWRTPTCTAMPMTSVGYVWFSQSVLLQYLAYITCIQCRDTYWVESFNHQLLTYLPKRIHFSTRVFNMRMNLAVMDWVRCMIYAVCIFISISL